MSLSQSGTYAGQIPSSSSSSRGDLKANFRYNILPSDYRGLYRKYNREAHGIDITVPPEQNVENWLDSKSKHYKPNLARAVFQYAARTRKEDRFKICIATPEMLQAAWDLCHQSQLVLDGTFGITSSRLLLWIPLALDKSGHGLPLAMFLFSAPAGNQATHAGYNTAILRELLSSWRNWLQQNQYARSRSFIPHMAITDTDTKERAALIQVWPDIILTLCTFHVRQCWKNKRNALFPKGDNIHATLILSQLSALEER